MSDYLQLGEYLAALEEATTLIGRSPRRASPDDERLDVLLHRIAAFPPAYVGLAGLAEGADSRAQLARLRADVETFVRKRAERSAVAAFPIRQHGVGRTL
ncbi:hypothetical protein LJR225_003682 [Phenylobacterium sp. LjRoot225]|uniref:hypothetical protein n=1 Tax=Phenylobacterium sp. LjRoot225 TaxID=3342285 RepID=UPI003ED0F6E4